MTNGFYFDGGSANEALGPSPPDRTLLQIGRLTYRLGLFENFLIVLVRSWLPEDERPSLEAMAKWQTTRKIAVARERNSIKQGRARDQFVRSLQLAETAYEVRNHVVHGMWMIDPVEERAVSVNPARGQLERLVDEIDHAAEAADGALRSLLTAMFWDKDLGDPPFPIPLFSEKPPQQEGK